MKSIEIVKIERSAASYLVGRLEASTLQVKMEPDYPRARALNLYALAGPATSTGVVITTATQNVSVLILMTARLPKGQTDLSSFLLLRPGTRMQKLFAFI
jgi:hypothetical protein